MISEFISRAFAIRDAAHFAHWSTDSGFHHGVLGDFYESVIGLTDRFVEAYIGNFNTIPTVTTQGGKLKDAKSFLKLLEADVVWMAENEDKICEELDVLENILQEIQELYLSTVLKLKRYK